MKPRKKMGFAQKENEKQNKRYGKKGRKGFGKVGQGAAPPGVYRVHDDGKKKPPLSDGRPQQKVDQIGLPGPFGMLGKEPEDKGAEADHDQEQADQHERLFL